MFLFKLYLWLCFYFYFIYHINRGIYKCYEHYYTFFFLYVLVIILASKGISNCFWIFPMIYSLKNLL
jgi:hypothetical protein